MLNETNLKAMETIINQVGQKITVVKKVYQPNSGSWQVQRIRFRYFIGVYACEVYQLFEGSEFNPVLLKDGTIIPYYKYNGQPVK